MIGLDTNALIDLFKNEGRLQNALDSFSGPFGTTILTDKNN